MDAPELARARRRLAAELEGRGLLRDGRSAFGTDPVVLPAPSQPRPQRLDDASRGQRRIVVFAHATPPAGNDRCAAWVGQVFSQAGLAVSFGDAADIFRDWCHETDPARLLVGMVVAVGMEPYSTVGRSAGHVGVYVGDDLVMDCVAGRVRQVPLQLWLDAYGLMERPRWGWLGGVALA